MASRTAPVWTDPEVPDPEAPAAPGNLPTLEVRPPKQPPLMPNDPIVADPEAPQGRPNAKLYTGYGAGGGTVPNFVAGAVGAAQGLAGGAADFATGGYNIGAGLVNKLAGTKLPLDQTPGYIAYLKDEAAKGNSPIGKVFPNIDERQIPQNDVFDKAARAAGDAVMTAPLYATGLGVAGKVLPGMAGRLASRAGQSFLDNPIKSEVEAAAQGSGGAMGRSALEDMGGPGWAGDIGGALVTGMAPRTGMQLGRSLVHSLVPTDAETQHLIQSGQHFNVPVNVANVTDQPWLATLNSFLKNVPGSGGATALKDAKTAWARAVNSHGLGLDDGNLASLPANLRPASLDAVTKETFTAADHLASGTIDRIEKSYPLRVDNALVQRLNDIENEAVRKVPERADQIREMVKTARDHLSNFQTPWGGNPASPHGEVPADIWASIVHNGEILGGDKLAGASDSVKGAYRDIRQALYDAYQRSMPSREWDAYQQARANYSNIQTLRPILGMKDTENHKISIGEVNPERILGLVNEKNGKDFLSYERSGDHNLAELARLGQLTRDGKTSMSAERLWARKMLETFGHAGSALAGVVLSGHSPLTLSALGPAAAGAGTLYGVSRGLNNLMQTPAGAIENFGTRAVNDFTHQAAPFAAGVGANTGPSVNPQTGFPEFSMQAAENKAERQHVSDPLLKGLIGSGRGYRSFLEKNKPTVHAIYGGSGYNRAHQVGAAMSRGGEGKTLLRTAMDELEAGDGPASRALRGAGIHHPEHLVHHALQDGNVATILSTPGATIAPLALKRLIKAIKDGGGTGGGAHRSAGTGGGDQRRAVAPS